MKNALLRAFVRIAKKPPTSTQHHRILIVSTTGLGDTLWALPSLDGLRVSFPEARLLALTSPIGYEVLSGHPALERLYVWSKRPWSLWRQLQREDIDTILFFHTSQRLVLPLCAALGAHTLVGTQGRHKGLDSLLTHRLPDAYQHEITRRAAMVCAIGGTVADERLNLPTPSGIILHPGSKDSYKRWPHFATLGRLLREELGQPILLTGSSDERPLLESLAAQIPGATCHVLPLSGLARLLQSAQLLIANDTGPVHLALALQRPVIALYAPTDPALCGPHQATYALALAKPPTCTPCLKRRCRRPFCLLQITPRAVCDAAKSFLKIAVGV